jgi:uncharacterized membrane protein (DUF106 family)
MAIIDLILVNPRTSIIILSFCVTLFITIVTHFVTDREVMREIKRKQKWIQQEMKKYKDNADKMMELNKQMMEHLPEQMKQSFKPMLITIVPLLIFFFWLRGVFATTIIASTWIWWYIGSSIIFSMILRKVFKLD